MIHQEALGLDLYGVFGLLIIGFLFLFRVNRHRIKEVTSAESLSQKGQKVEATVKEIKDIVPDGRKTIYHLVVNYRLGSESHQTIYIHEIDKKAPPPKKGDMLEVFTDANNKGMLYNRPAVPAWLMMLYRLRAVPVVIYCIALAVRFLAPILRIYLTLSD